MIVYCVGVCLLFLLDPWFRSRKQVNAGCILLCGDDGRKREVEKRRWFAPKNERRRRTEKIARSFGIFFLCSHLISHRIIIF